MTREEFIEEFLKSEKRTIPPLIIGPELEKELDEALEEYFKAHKVKINDNDTGTT